MEVFVLLIILALLISLYWYETQRRKHCASLPPGPPPLPLLGNILLLIGDKRPDHDIFEELSKKFGDVMTFWAFTNPIIVCSSVEAMREAFIENNISDRPPLPLANLALPDIHLHLPMSNYNDRFRKMRKSMIQAMRASVIDQTTQNAIGTIAKETICDMLQRGADKSQVNFHDASSLIIYQAMAHVAFGKRVATNDPLFLEVLSAHRTLEKTITTNFILSPALKLITTARCRIISAVLEARTLMHVTYRRFASSGYEEAKRNTSSARSACLVDCLMVHLGIKEKLTSTELTLQRSNEFEDDDVIRLVVDMFLAAASTTPAALSWLVVEMIRRPDIQERCQLEIRNVLQGRPATISDRRRLPYTEACLMEVIRCHMTTITIAHYTRTKIRLRGYEIPAATNVVSNLRAVHHDKDVFKNPLNFDPENFLDANGEFSRPRSMALFGIGQRLCPGEAFAKSVLFLSFVTLMQHVRFCPAAGLDYSDRSGENTAAPEANMATVDELPS